jgi:putative aldouronate transport system substrate-binding protein
MSYGPDAFIKTNADGSYVTFDFNGEQWPVIADATFKELWDKAGGNYTNYARQYLGSTLSFVKSQSFEYQCTTAAGKEGAGYISRAIALGTIKHPPLAITENMWWTSVPTVLPTTAVQNTELGTFTELTSSGNAGMFSSSKDDSKSGTYPTNLLINVIVEGYAGEGWSNRAEMINTIKTTWGGDRYLQIKNGAWLELVDFYNTIK